MGFEVRAYTKRDIDWLINSPCDSIGLGSETCVHRLFPFEGLLKDLKTIVNTGIRARLVTPLLSNSFVGKISRLVEQVIRSEMPVDITFNDYGLLYKNRELLQNSNQKYTLGRLLAKSVDNWPWNSRIVEHETEYAREYILQNNCCYDKKLIFLKQLGISSVEFNYKPSQLSCLSSLKKHGIEVLAHLDFILLAVSRSCPTVRLHESTIPFCHSLCKDAYTLDLVGREGHVRTDAQEKDENVFSEYPQLIVWGNGIYQKNTVKFPTLDSGKTDKYIITVHDKSSDEGIQLMNRLKKLGHASL